MSTPTVPLMEPPPAMALTPDETGPPSGAGKWISRALDGLLGLVIVAVVLLVIGGSFGWWQIETVLSGSMRPAIQPGDIELVRPEPISAVRVGQILAVRPPNVDATITHRVIAITHNRGATYVRTKGDANDVADPWGEIKLVGTKAWKVDLVLPKLGYVSVWAKARSVRLALLIGVVALTIVSLLARIWRRT